MVSGFHAQPGSRPACYDVIGEYHSSERLRADQGDSHHHFMLPHQRNPEPQERVHIGRARDALRWSRRCSTAYCGFALLRRMKLNSLCASA